MIITLKGCTATAFIGGLNFFKVSKGTVSGADVTISTSTINKDAATSTSAREIATVALKSNYENLVVTVTMGGTPVTWFADGKVTIPANTTVTGDIKISANATAVVPDVPVTPTMYTFTINPTPATATVTLTASGYSQSGNSITVPANTVVTWKVSASGYTEQTGTETINDNLNKTIELIEEVQVINLWTWDIETLSSALEGGKYRTSNGKVYKEDTSQDGNLDFNYNNPSTDKIYVNGNSGDYTLPLEGGKTYRWQLVPQWDFGTIHLNAPWTAVANWGGKSFWIYDSNDELIQNDTANGAVIDGQTTNLMTIPTNASYIRFAVPQWNKYKTQIGNAIDTRLMITEGTTEYTEYVAPQK